MYLNYPMATIFQHILSGWVKSYAAENRTMLQGGQQLKHVFFSLLLDYDAAVILKKSVT